MLGVVVIGRNEGDRLKVCLQSIIKYTDKVIYVDSGSSDGSVEFANEIGVHTLSLDLNTKFTAARARNEGFYNLYKIYNDIKYVHFVDGDCEIADGWIEAAIDYMSNNDNIAVVCGQRKERYPDVSVYNKLCDIEWNTPVGKTKSCGGDALYRVDIFDDVNGFNPSLIAGEEPELCVRIRSHGGEVWRIDKDMTWHDANITRFWQWWNRNVRAGYSYVLGYNLHGSSPEYHCKKNLIRGQFWGILIPLLVITGASFNIYLLSLLFVYPMQVIRIALKYKEDIDINWLYAFFITLSKFAEAQGQIKCFLDIIFNRNAVIIEYK